MDVKMENGPQPQFGDDKKKSIPDLIFILRSSFHAVEFDRIQGILEDREAELKREVNKKKEEIKKERDYRMLQEVKYEYDLNEMKEKAAKAEKTYETLLEKVKKEGRDETVIVELRRKNSELESAKKRVEEELQQTEGKFQDLKTRLLRLEARFDEEINWRRSNSSNMAVENVRSNNGKNDNGKNYGSCNTNSSHVQREVIVSVSNENSKMSMPAVSPPHPPTEEKGGLQTTGGVKFASGDTILIDDSDDDCAPRDILCEKEISQKLADLEHSRMTGEENRLRVPKRKRPSPVNIGESESDENYGGNTIPTIQKKQHQGLGLEPNGSPLNHCLPTDIPCAGNHVEKLTTPSSHVEKMAALRNSLSFINQFRRGKMDDYVIGDISSASESESESESEDDIISCDIQSLVAKNNKNGEIKRWASETDMVAAFEKDHELCLNAVCALYRRHISAGKSAEVSTISNNRGFNKFDAHRATSLARYLIDGDPQGKLKRSVKQLEMEGWADLSDCRRLAVQHSKQLFDMYKNKEDPLFIPS